MKNKYEIIENDVIIYLENRKKEIIKTIIDISDFDKINNCNLKWNASWEKRGKVYYVKASEYLGIFDGKPKYKTHYIHRIIFGENSEHIDHIDNNPLNNKKGNLRETTMDKNTKNRKGLNLNNSTGERNVSWSKCLNKYLVQFQINGKNKVFGKFNKNQFEDAVKLAQEKRFELYYK